MSVTPQLVHEAGLSPEQAELLRQFWLVDPRGMLTVLALDDADEGAYRVADEIAETLEAVTLPDGTEVTADPKALFSE